LNQNMLRVSLSRLAISSELKHLKRRSKMRSAHLNYQ
jgi:hypothetical protein